MSETSKLKGEWKLAKDLQAGDVVEYDDALKEAHRAGYGEAIPDTAIINSVQEYNPGGPDPKYYIQALPWIKDTFGGSRFLYTKNGTSLDYISSNQKVRVLTGKMRDTLHERRRASVLTVPGLLEAYGKTVGSDPEIFAVDGKGELLPAYLWLEKKPKAPIGFPAQNYRHGEAIPNSSVYWDGFQAEFNTQTYTCLAQHAVALRLGLWKTWHLARQHDPNARLTIRNVFHIDPRQLQEASQEHVALGCAPSNNAYGDSGETFDDARMLMYRFAGGHIHQARPDKKNAAELVKFLDKTLGIAGVVLAAGIDDPIRRRYYGLAGEYRLPQHGLEYRVLSNFWLGHPAIYYLVFEWMRLCVRLFDSGAAGLWKADENDVRHIINGCDVDAAKKIMQANADVIAKLLPLTTNNAFKNNQLNFKLAVHVLQHGISELGIDMENIPWNWGFDQRGAVGILHCWQYWGNAYTGKVKL